MHFLPIILATVLGVVATVPVTSTGFKERIFNVASSETEKAAKIKELLETNDILTRNSIIEDILWNVIDLARKIIVNGNDDIPVLDPFELDQLHLDGDLVDLPNSHVTLNNINVVNLGTFEIDKLKVYTVSIILQRYRILLDGRIPVLDAQADNYDLSIDIFGATIVGNGEMKYQIVNPRIYADIEIGVRLSITGIYVTVRDCRIQFKLDEFKAQITGLFGDEVASEFVSDFLSSVVPEFLEFFEDDITRILSETILELANDLLGDLNLIDLLS